MQFVGSVQLVHACMQVGEGRGDKLVKVAAVNRESMACVDTSMFAWVHHLLPKED